MANKPYYGEKHTFKEQQKLDKDRATTRRYCKNCGHSTSLMKPDWIPCSHCGSRIYKNDLIEFRYKAKEEIKKLGV